MPQRSIPQRTRARLQDLFQWLDDAQWPIPALLVCGFFYAFLALPFAGSVLVGTLLLLIVACWRYLHTNFLDLRIRRVFRRVRRWSCYHRVYPRYKWVDIYRAAQSLATEHPTSTEIVATCNASLQRLLLGRGVTLPERRSSPAVQIPRKTGYTTEIFLPNDTLWLIHADDQHRHGDCIIRVRYVGPAHGVLLEVATRHADDGAPLLDQLLERARQHSIYRRQIISPVFQHELKSDYRDDDSGDTFDITFQPPPGVDDSNIVLDDTIRELIEWSIIDFHQRRSELMQAGLPGRRGILFYGPPGTGKTYTCKYIAHRLADATTILATGKALGEIKTICQLAKQFQPALVILEDVDLIFSSRETNPYVPILGEFLEELDGFRADDQVIFLLTTNAIDRVEGAIKDRPGRVSQCIYLGAPNAALRHRYLMALLAPYPAARVDLGRVIGRTEGVSQAFLKEMVARAVQIATASQPDVSPGRLLLEDAHLDAAQAQMLAGNDLAGKRIIGFQVGL